MLMFHFHMTFALGLIAFALGASVLIWSKAHESVGTSLAKLIGYIVIILAVINLLCTGYYAVKYSQEGSFDKPYPMMMQHQKMQGQMMPGMMMKNDGMNQDSGMKMKKPMPN